MCVLIKNEAIDVDDEYYGANNGVALTAPSWRGTKNCLIAIATCILQKKIVLQVVVNDLELFQLFFARL